MSQIIKKNVRPKFSDISKMESKKRLTAPQACWSVSPMSKRHSYTWSPCIRHPQLLLSLCYYSRTWQSTLPQPWSVTHDSSLHTQPLTLQRSAITGKADSVNDLCGTNFAFWYTIVEGKSTNDKSRRSLHQVHTCNSRSKSSYYRLLYRNY